MDAVRLDNEAAGSSLSQRDRQFSSSSVSGGNTGAKEQACELFDMSATRYYQIINARSTTLTPWRSDPMHGQALAPDRAARQRARSARRLGIDGSPAARGAFA